VVSDGDLTRKQRDKLLADMTDDVATAGPPGQLPPGAGDQRHRGPGAAAAGRARPADPQPGAGHRLDRRLEFLPDNEELAERRAAGKGLTRPSWPCCWPTPRSSLQDELVASDVPEDDYLADDLERYMPPKLRERFRRQLHRHPLRRDIIATYVTNSMVNRAGSTFANRLRDETGAGPPDVARAYTIAREVFDVRRLWKDLAALDNVVPAQVQLELQAEGRKIIERSALWFLRNRRQPAGHRQHRVPLRPRDRLAGPGAAQAARPGRVRGPGAADRAVLAAGVPAELATRVASLDALFSGLNVIEVAAACGETVETVAAVYFALGYRLDLHWLRDQIARLPARPTGRPWRRGRCATTSTPSSAS
jgi:glutamate dehydrogenase